MVEVSNFDLESLLKGELVKVTLKEPLYLASRTKNDDEHTFELVNESCKTVAESQGNIRWVREVVGYVVCSSYSKTIKINPFGTEAQPYNNLPNCRQGDISIEQTYIKEIERLDTGSNSR